MHIEPQYAVDQEYLLPVSDYPSHMQAIPTSRMFLLKKALKAYTDRVGADAKIYDASQGDGGQSLPGVPRHILDAAHQIQVTMGTGYDAPNGTERFRKAVAEKYWQLDPSLGWSAANVVATQGGRDGLTKAYTAMIACGYGRVGDALVVSAVPWISYNWGPYAAGLNVLRASGDPDHAWEYTPETLKETVEFAAARGQKVAGLVLTSPDNPTGRTLTLSRQIELAQTALDLGVGYVLFDWIYHWVSDEAPHDVNEVLRSFSPEQRNRLMFLDGITKSLGGSNIRNCHLLASEEVCKFITSRASHDVIPSLHSQAVAIAAYEGGFAEVAATINEPTNASRHIMRDFIAEKGLQAILGNGYYAFINVEEWVKAGGFNDTEDLGQALAEDYGVAIVPGVYFSDAGKYWIRFSYALPPQLTAAAVARFYEALEGLKK